MGPVHIQNRLTEATIQNRAIHSNSTCNYKKKLLLVLFNFLLLLLLLLLSLLGLSFIDFRAKIARIMGPVQVILSFCLCAHGLWVQGVPDLEKPVPVGF